MPDLDLPNGPTIHYLDLNPAEQRSILLLHGLGANGASWQLQLPALTALGYRVIAPDTRGFGQSTYPSPAPASIQAAARDFASLIERLGIAPLDVVGISMGGAQALSLALDYPELVRRLVLVNTFARLRPSSLDEWLYFALRFLVVHTLGIEAQARKVSVRIFPRPDQSELRAVLIQQVMQAEPKAYRAAMRALAMFNVKDRLSEIRVPTLVITGELDTTVSRAVQQQLVDGIHHARQVLVPGAGHAVSVDTPDCFNQILTDFLAETGGTL